MSPINLDTHTALITGASRGLGRALAIQLAAQGARVVLVARHEGPLQQVVAGIRAAGGQAWGVAADVGHPDTPARVLTEAAALAGPVSLLINNASTLGASPLPLLADLQPDTLERVLQVNVLGPFRFTREVVGHMLLQGRGVVVNISSDAAVNHYPEWGGYGASKAALDHLSATWAAEFQGTGLRFLAVDPGEMNTVMHAAALPDADPDAQQDPSLVAHRIVHLLRHPEHAPSGSRVQAERLEVPS